MALAILFMLHRRRQNKRKRDIKAEEIKPEFAPDFEAKPSQESGGKPPIGSTTVNSFGGQIVL